MISSLDRVKNRRTALSLVLIVIGLVVYSLAVIWTRGSLPEPTNLTPLQRILRGL